MEVEGRGTSRRARSTQSRRVARANTVLEIMGRRWADGKLELLFSSR